MTDYVIIKDCPRCEERTAHRREQGAREEDGEVIIATTFECGEYGTQREKIQPYG